MVVEHIDTAALQQIMPPPPKQKWASLKSLEAVLATVTEAGWAHDAIGPLHGVYNLRLADAHIASNGLDAEYELASWSTEPGRS